MNSVKDQFPQLLQRVNDQSVVYLDSAATALKPKIVIDRIKSYYTNEIANVHRGAHYFADQGTTFFEEARESVAKFINAHSSEEIIFTRGTTESINLVAQSWGTLNLKPGDEILLTELEHHSNIVPWQLVAEKTGAVLRVVPIDGNGDLQMENLKELIHSKTKMVSLLYVSNAIGVVNPIEEIIALAKNVGAKVCIDAAQSMTTLSTDVQKWDCDFLAFSGHKTFGPTGIGILYGKRELLNEMPPYQSGGSMIDHVSFEGTTFLPSPQRFEAGTPHVAGAIGLKTSIDFINNIGIDHIRKIESELVDRAVAELSKVDGLKIIGNPKKRMNVVSFLLDGIHHGDIGALLDQQGIAVRVGHHCCQPLMKALGISGTVRASFSVYNTNDDVDRLVEAVKKAKEFF